MRLVVLLAVLLAAPVFAAPVPKQDKKITDLDGTWEMVEQHRSGKRDDPAKPIHWTIDGDSLVIKMQSKKGFQQVEGTTFQLVKPAGGKANEIDFVLTHNDDRDHTPVVFPGVFELDADTFKLSTPSGSPGKRPTKCESTKDIDFLIFKRVKDKQGK